MTEVLARDEQCVESGQARSHDADVTRFYQRRPLDWNWLQCGHRHLFRRSTPPLHGAAEVRLCGGARGDALSNRLLNFPHRPYWSDGRTTQPRESDKAMTKAKSGEKGGESPSQLIDARIAELGDWRGETLARIRKLIKEADPDVVEDWKWRGVPVWYHAGMLCTGETYKNVVKITFAKGASLDDSSSLFNSSLDGNTRRAIDIHENDKINEKALKTLIRAAVALNTS
jgi:hypothetical protein